jgi:MYXO-CTERM domain-containing protein
MVRLDLERKRMMKRFLKTRNVEWRLTMLYATRRNKRRGWQMSMRKAMAVLIALGLLLAASPGYAGVIAIDSFDYGAGELKDENGGSGWKDKWSGDDALSVVVPGALSYADSLGNTLVTHGGHVRSTSTSTKKAERDLSNTWGSNGTTVWIGMLIEGAAGTRQTNLGLADKFFVGQGGNSNTHANWTVYDQDGLAFNSGVAAGNNQDFLVAQIDFKSGNETAWLWINPDLDATPVKSAASNGSSGSSVKEFTFDKVELYFNQSNDGFIDELRLATTFAEVAPYAAPMNDSAIATSASQAFGRMMLGQTPTSGDLALGKTGLQATTYTATASNNGLSVTADGSIAGGAQTENITVGLVNNANGSGSTGAKSWTVTVDNTATTSAGSGQGSADGNETINVSGTVVDDRVVTAADVNAGRIMAGGTQGSALSTTGDDDNYTRVTVATTAADGGDGVSVTGGTGTTFNSAGSTGNRTVQFATAGAKSGTLTLTTTGEGLTGESAVDVDIDYTATVVDNRDLSQQGGAVVLGKVLVGSDTATGTATITGGAEDDNHATRVTLGTGDVTQNEVTVGGGSSKTFNGSSQTTTRDVVGNFSTSGAKSGSVNIAGQLSDADTVTGDTPDSTIAVSFTATAYEAAAAIVNNLSTLYSGQNALIQNASPVGALRSNAVVDTIQLSNARWSLAGLSAGDEVAAGAQGSGALSFDPSGLLYGQVFQNTLSIYLENEQSIAGAANRDLNGGSAYVWNLEHTVAASAGGNADVGSGADYDGLGATSGAGTDAMLLDGTAGATRTVSMSFGGGAGDGFNVIGNVLSLDGTNGDTFVLQMSYDETELMAGLTPFSEGQAAAAELIYLAYKNGGEWVNAVDYNIGGTPNYVGNVAYDDALHFALGNYGVDTANDVVWAVLNHNSEFGVGFEEPVAEPAGLSLIGLALLGLRRRRS